MYYHLNHMRYFPILIFLILLISCTKPVHESNEITKIELARSGAWSDFGAAISVDTSLNYTYYGKYGNIKKGYFIGKITQGLWDTLNQKFEQIQYKNLKPIVDSMNIVDVNYFELIIHWKNEKLRIVRVRPRETDSLMNVILWLNDSYKQIKLRQVKTPFKFETTFQNPPPTPTIDLTKFPPPIKSKYLTK